MLFLALIFLPIFTAPLLIEGNVLHRTRFEDSPPAPDDPKTQITANRPFLTNNEELQETNPKNEHPSNRNVQEIQSFQTDVQNSEGIAKTQTNTNLNDHFETRGQNKVIKLDLVKIELAKSQADLPEVHKPETGFFDKVSVNSLWTRWFSPPDYPRPNESGRTKKPKRRRSLSRTIAKSCSKLCGKKESKPKPQWPSPGRRRSSPKDPPFWSQEPLPEMTRSQMEKKFEELRQKSQSSTEGDLTPPKKKSPPHMPTINEYGSFFPENESGAELEAEIEEIAQQTKSRERGESSNERERWSQVERDDFFEQPEKRPSPPRTSGQSPSPTGDNDKGKKEVSPLSEQGMLKPDEIKSGFESMYKRITSRSPSEIFKDVRKKFSPAPKTLQKTPVDEISPLSQAGVMKPDEINATYDQLVKTKSSRSKSGKGSPHPSPPAKNGKSKFKQVD